MRQKGWKMRPIDADALKEKFPHNSDWEYPVNTNSDVVEAINEMPTVKAEPEHGHWVINGEWCTCSECKQSLHYERSKGKSNLINALSMAVKFCPSCGAKMDVRKEE